jgi:hypothetical protein
VENRTLILMPQARLIFCILSLVMTKNDVRIITVFLPPQQ